MGETINHYDFHKRDGIKEEEWKLDDQIVSTIEENIQLQEKMVSENNEESVELIIEPPKEDPKIKTQSGKYYFSSFERCQDQRRRAGPDIKPALIFLAILYQKTMRSRKILRK